MTKLLAQVFEKAGRLSDELQDRLAKQILEEFMGDYPSLDGSPDKMEQLSEKTEQEYQVGKTKGLIGIHPQYIMDENKQCKAILLTSEEWEKILEELEELDDIRAYDEAKSGPQDSIIFAEAVHEIEHEYNK